MNFNEMRALIVFIVIFSCPFFVFYIMYLYHSFMFKKYGHYFFEESYKKVLRENMQYLKLNNSNNSNKSNNK